MSRLLCVHPGASWAVSDVYEGLVGALRRQGHECIDYALGYWIEEYGEMLERMYQQRQEREPACERYNDADILRWASKDILPLALHHEPDWVIIVSGMFVHPDVLAWLKRCGFRVALVLTESPYDDGPQATRLGCVDVAFTNERASVPFLRQFSPHVYYLPHAYDPEKHSHLLPPAGEAGAAHDVVFVGTGFAERVALLEAVDWSGIDLGLYGTWSLLAEGSPLMPCVCGGITPNSETAALYRAAKVGLNLYRGSHGYGENAPQVTTGESVNPRMLELAANGVFTLSNHRAEQGELLPFLPTFETAPELADLVRYYLAHESERQAIAARLPGAVAARTFDQMATQVVATLDALGG